jgi:hypothetical protein
MKASAARAARSIAVRHPAEEGNGAMKRKTAVEAVSRRCAAVREASMARF